MARKGKMIEKIIDSVYLNEKKSLKIYYPRIFSTIYKYNLCIMFDGDDYYQMGRVATFSDELHEAGKIKNTIFIGIHYKTREDRRRKYHPNGAENTAFTNFVMKEVIPLLDEMIPVDQTRILMGDSLAGSFALLTALRYPDTFSKVIMHSPYVDDAILATVKQQSHKSELSIYHTIGALETRAKLVDGRVIDQLTPNRDLNEFLTNHISDITYYELENGERTWKFWQRDMKRALTAMIEPEFKND